MRADQKLTAYVELQRTIQEFAVQICRGFEGASTTPTEHEQYGSRMKAPPERRESAMLVERAQGVMRESRKLLEQREAQLKQMERFVMLADEKLTAFLELESTIKKKSLGG